MPLGRSENPFIRMVRPFFFAGVARIEMKLNIQIYHDDKFDFGYKLAIIIYIVMPL